MQRSRVLGKVSRVNRTAAREKMADIVKPINDRAATAISQNIELKQFVQPGYLPSVLQAEVEAIDCDDE